jgi:hypothetical protein
VETSWTQQKITFSFKFQVVTEGSKENEEFFASTPAGTVEVSTVRNDTFQVGKEYYLDFTDA